MTTSEETAELLARFYDADIDTRWHATEALRHVWGEWVVDVLLERLHDPEPALRAKAAQVLARRWDARIVPELLSLLNDLDVEVQVAAIESLSGQVERRILGALLVCLDDAAPEVRAAAAQGLWPYRTQRAIDGLLARLRDVDAQVRKAALKALMEQSDPRTLAPVIAVMENEDEEDEVREQAIEALGYIAQGHTFDFWDFVYPERDAVEHLLDMIDTRLGTYNTATGQIYRANEEFSRLAIEALARIGDQRAVEPLVALLCDWHAEFGLRLWSLGALGELKDFRVTPILIATLRDPQPLIRPFAAHALQDLCDPSALPELDRLAQDEPDRLSEAAAKAAAHIRYEVSWLDFDNLLNYLNSPDEAERRRAVAALSQSAEPRAMDALLNRLPAEHDVPDAILVLCDIATVVANAGEARALPLLAAAAEYWAARDIKELPEILTEAADFIQRKLKGEDVGRYINPLDDEADAIEFDDELDED